MSFTNRSLVFFKTRLPFYKYFPSIPGTFIPIPCPYPVASFPDVSPLHRASDHHLLLSPFPCYSRFEFLVPFHLRHHCRDLFLIFQFSVSRSPTSVNSNSDTSYYFLHSSASRFFHSSAKTIFSSFLGIPTFSLFGKINLFYFIHSSAFRIFTFRQIFFTTLKFLFECFHFSAKIILLHFFEFLFTNLKFLFECRFGLTELQYLSYVPLRTLRTSLCRHIRSILTFVFHIILYRLHLFPVCVFVYSTTSSLLVLHHI